MNGPVRMGLCWALALALWLATPGAAHAYVGPGAGFAFVGSFATLLLAFGAAFLSLITWPIRFVIRSFRRRKALRRARVKRMVILGFDGLDPGLCERWMEAGQLPNMKALANSGSFTRLQTTFPSMSPVAWSSFMTGVDPARHNIFDFLNRDLRTYQPHLSSSQVSDPPRNLKIGGWVIPLGKPVVRGMRRSRAFWSVLGDHRVPCNILRVPLSFPPEKFPGALLSAMCVPDLRGTQGAFTYYTTDPKEVGQQEETPEGTGGERALVEIKDGVIEATLPGPANSLRASAETLQLPFRLELDFERREGTLRIDGQDYRLKEREYSPWVRLSFKAGLGIKVRGIARFYITRMEPQLGLYVTPINIDPGKPALPISFPNYYSVYLSKLLGEFATLGLAEDTWALNERVIDEGAFLQQALDHHEERERMFMNALEKSREGVVVCVFDGTDRLQHMFYRYLEDDHPANRGQDVEKYRDVILEMYKRCDDLVGRLRAQLKEDDQLIILSDHGFASFRRGVNLNSWLQQNGLLELEEGVEQSGAWFQGVDWSRSKAYAFGLGGIYLNLKGREGQGIVEPGEEAEKVKRQIIEGLSGLHDEQEGAEAICEVFDSQAVFPSGPYRENAPDLIVGYNRGYRASWAGAVGRTTGTVLSDNTKAWSGDHCIDPRQVPGVLFSSRAIAEEEPEIVDLAPTILTQFGVDPPEYMTGHVLEVDSSAAPSAGPRKEAA
jgi:predicted AlkP superfamily phosphohydrolase/phosphomutase